MWHSLSLFKTTLEIYFLTLIFHKRSQVNYNNKTKILLGNTTRTAESRKIPYLSIRDCVQVQIENLHFSFSSWTHNLDFYFPLPLSRLPQHYSASLTARWISNSDRAKGIWLYPLRTVWLTENPSLHLRALSFFVLKLTSLLIILFEKLIFFCVWEDNSRTLIVPKNNLVESHGRPVLEGSTILQYIPVLRVRCLNLFFLSLLVKSLTTTH